MNHITRRNFLKLGAMMAAAAGFSNPFAKVFADGLEKLVKRKPRVLWLQGQSCSGCSVSLLNTDYPDTVSLITDIISMVFHQTISAAQGHIVMESIQKVPEAGPFVLAIEGSIPVKMPGACVMSGRNFADILEPLLGSAQYVIAIGNCASYGGIPAAEGNETGALGVKDFMVNKKIRFEQKLINLPGCPTHPDAIVGTLAYLAGHDYPSVNPELLTPDMYYHHSTHDDCPRYHDYNKHIYAQKFGDRGCLFKLGCLGMLTKTECPRRQWNSGVNWCVRAAAPCVGCSQPDFARHKDFPFYRKGESVHQVKYNDSDRKGGVA